MVAVTVHCDFGAQENKISHGFHFYSFYFYYYPYTVFVEVAMARAGLHWRSLLRELCQRRIRRGELEDTRGV